MLGAVIQLTVEGSRAMTFSLLHNCPREDENWVLDITSLKVEQLDAHWSSAEHEGSVRAETNVLICPSLLSCLRKSAQLLQKTNFDRTICHQAAYQNCTCCLSPFPLYFYFWCKPEEGHWMQTNTKP